MTGFQRPFGPVGRDTSPSSPVCCRSLLVLRRKTDGAALQTDLQTVGRLTTVLQYPTIPQGRASVLVTAGHAPRGPLAAAAERVTARATRQTLGQDGAQRHALAEQTGQHTVNTAVWTERGNVTLEHRTCETYINSVFTHI